MSSGWARWRRANPERARELAAQHTRAYKNRYPWATCLSSVRISARKRGILCTIDSQWARDEWTGRCAVTGLEFAKSATPSPFSPSIDRINPRSGYTRKNCRFVLLGYNMLKHVGTDTDVLKIAEAICAKNKTT